MSARNRLVVLFVGAALFGAVLSVTRSPFWVAVVAEGVLLVPGLIWWGLRDASERGPGCPPPESSQGGQR